LAEPAEFLLVALSGRALAVAARRAGRRARVLDLFGDTDTRASAAASLVVAGDLARGFDETSLLACAERIAPGAVQPACGLVYGAGLEDRPALLERLSRGRRLYGNSPRTVARTKDPRTFFPLLDRLRIPCPDTAFTARADPGDWLVKRIGASGGAHVSAASLAGVGPDLYYQRRVPGVAVGASFLADGERALVLGFSEQWTSPGARDAFRFGGAVQPASLHPRIEVSIRADIARLVPALGLVGLNSLDVIVGHDRYAVIEVNPRPGANLDIFDGTGPGSLFAHHVAACEGRLPEQWTPPGRATAMAVVYAQAPGRAPASITWPDWVVDRPAPGAHVAGGAPVCTVLSSAATSAAARRLAAERVAAVLSALEPRADAAGQKDDPAFAVG
jgi:predicted ATP-grasp superfamily ATP-dependent carboligase